MKNTKWDVNNSVFQFFESNISLDIYKNVCILKLVDGFNVYVSYMLIFYLGICSRCKQRAQA